MAKQSFNSSSETLYASRRSRLLKQIKGEVAIFPAASRKNSSADQSYHYLQDSNFLYLTGLNEEDALLVLSGLARGPRSILYIKDRNPTQERWEGERLGIKRAKRRFRVDEVRPLENFSSELSELTKGAAALHYAPGSHELVDEQIWKLLKCHVAPRYQQPNILRDSRLLLAEMRFTKDRAEMAIMKHAADITAHAMKRIAPHLPKLKSEVHCARFLEEQYSQLGASGLAFHTIVASGKHATVLHHHPKLTPLWKRELVLIDSGAAFRGYASDLTRVFPVSGKFSNAQAEVYDVVLSAQLEAEKRAVVGNSMNQIHDGAVRELVKGLVSLGVLRGGVPDLMNKGTYRRFYPHRTGHYVGIDVHDIAPLRDYPTSYAIPLAAGNVITNEPGLYFDPREDGIPRELRGIGIRIEDTILITSAGPDVLTAAMPKSREDIEGLLAAQV